MDRLMSLLLAMSTAACISFSMKMAEEGLGAVVILALIVGYMTIGPDSKKGLIDDSDCD